ncbi:VOC family protein [Micrococcales bacterium 31B]|nr:VOC family protein [Micrococcales bacterium 31B]
MTSSLPLIHHTGLWVTDFSASEAIYTSALATLDIERGVDEPGFAEYWRVGVDTPSFCIEQAPSAEVVTRGLHVAFTAPDRAHVDAFFEAAVAAGATVRHAPRAWPEYRAYCAFVSDPDGNNVEALVKEIANL